MKKIHSLPLLLLLVFYSLIYVATSRALPRDGDCALVDSVNVRMLKTHGSYVYGVYRCSYPRVSDTICVNVKDTIGIDWNMVADSTCYYANQAGLQRQKVFVLKDFTRRDTLAKRQCP